MTEIMKKQYVLAAKTLSIPGSQYHPLGNGYHLYTGEGLKVRKLLDGKGRECILLGEAFCVDESPKSVEESIESFAGEEVLKLLRTWTGRFLLIFENTVYRDAAGLMTAFMTDNILSSSCAVLRGLVDVGKCYPVQESGLTWRLLPGSVAENVSAVYPTEKICLLPKEMKKENLMWFQDKRNMTTEEKTTALAQMLKNAVGNIEKFSGRKLLVALTAGKDSRLVMSAALAAGVSFDTYTAQHGDISVADKTIPQKLAKQFDFPYRYIKRKKLSVVLLEDYDRFTCYGGNGADRKFYGYGQFQQIPADAVILRSGLFETAQVYGRSISQEGEHGFEKGFLAYYQSSLKDEKQKENFHNWLKYTAQNPCDFVDIRDRFYVEQRAGGWVAAIEQSLDMNDFLSIQIANSMDILSLLLSASDAERRELALSYETMRHLKPEVLTFAVNGRSVLDYWMLVKRKLVRLWAELKK